MLDTVRGQELTVSVLTVLGKVSVWRLSKILYYIDKKYDFQALFWSQRWYSPSPCDVTDVIEDLMGQGIVGYKLCPGLSVLLLRPLKLNKLVINKIREDVKRLASLPTVELIEEVNEIRGRETDCWVCELEDLYDEVERGDKCALKEIIGRVTDRYSSAILELPFMSINELEETIWKSIEEDGSKELLKEALLVLEGLDRASAEGDVEEVVRLRKRFLDLLQLYLSVRPREGFLAP